MIYDYWGEIVIMSGICARYAGILPYIIVNRQAFTLSALAFKNVSCAEAR